ncbi:hypothetical protein GQ42DRAFT_164184 [Ramicandelaber brevisporus]|nr:hypothetical protein GQ42DRAFT_165247 [Ramicandelaber brevisporus]KAI8868368.1 hypothetical protein GQ42DRAFT_164184 [Ramicandelaber brevisporus]
MLARIYLLGNERFSTPFTCHLSTHSDIAPRHTHTHRPSSNCQDHTYWMACELGYFF